MRTVNVKVELNEKIEFLSALQQAGLKLSDTILQHDRVFRGTQPDKKLIVRTETSPDGLQSYYLIYRQFSANDSTLLNYTTSVTNYEQTVRIIHGLGYKLVAEVDKQRQRVDITDTISLCFDKAKGLGEYIKLERAVSKDDNLNWVRADLAEALKALGISEGAKLASAYSDMTVKK
ncbi:CYTH domain-containing protein [Candidatus Saccharibacteria bacterium]|nr:CYTH domain-containing protein [Candidatus Saccharibacteria bacterium]